MKWSQTKSGLSVCCSLFGRRAGARHIRRWARPFDNDMTIKHGSPHGFIFRWFALVSNVNDCGDCVMLRCLLYLFACISALHNSFCCCCCSACWCDSHIWLTHFVQTMPHSKGHSPRLIPGSACPVATFWGFFFRFILFAVFRKNRERLFFVTK